MRISFASGCEEVAAADGTRLRYYDVGSGPISVVLLHGMFGSPANWLPIMRQLESHYRFIALQLPVDATASHRHSPLKSIGQFTDHVACLFTELGLDRAVVGGNSLGGQVAVDFCVRHPERVERLVLAGSAGLFERNLAGGIRPRLCRDYIRKQASQIFYDSAIVSDELVDDIYDMLSHRPYRKMIVRVAKCTRDRYVLDDLASIDVPTLIVWGREDSITPPFVAEQFQQNILNSKRVYIERCGHAPPIERPEEFALALHDFLCDLPSARPVSPGRPR